jgi:hypothetical protein
MERTVSNLASLAKLVDAANGALGGARVGFGAIRTHLEVIASCAKVVGVTQGARSPTHHLADLAKVPSLAVAIILRIGSSHRQ